MSDLRRRILDASIEMVAEEGVRALSFREVARQAGVSHQAPDHHFGDHRGILAEIAREGFVGLADAMSAAASGAEDPAAALSAAGTAYIDFARRHPGHFRVMFQAGARGTVVETVPEAARPKVVLEGLTDAAIGAGHSGGLAPDELVHLCWSTVHGYATLVVDGVLPGGPTDSGDGVEAQGAAVVESLASLLERATDPTRVARVTLLALGRRATTRPGTRSKVLGYALASTPRPMRSKIIGGVMAGFTAHQEADLDAVGEERG